jgi:hypothetical protein
LTATPLLVAPLLVAVVAVAVVALAAETAFLPAALPLALVATAGSITLFAVPLVELVVTPSVAAFLVFDAAGLRVVTTGV